MSHSVRDKLLDAAEELFGRAGFGAAGIDAIIARARVAKMSLYKHFGSKDALIAAVLARRDQRFRETFTAAVHRHGPSAVERLLAVFDIAAEAAAKAGHRPGLFLGAALEFPVAAHPARLAAVENARWLREFCESLAHEAGAADPPQVARQWLLLMHGALVETVLDSSSEPFVLAKSMGRSILDQ